MAAPLATLNEKALSLSINNRWRRKPLAAYPVEQLKTDAFAVDQDLAAQEKDLNALAATMTQLDTEAADLKTQLLVAVAEAQHRNAAAVKTRSLLQSLEMDLRRLLSYRGQLGAAIDAFERSPTDDIRLPFPFFAELHREQVKLIGVLASKVTEAENIAEALLRESHAQSATGQREQQSLKDKIFEICSMLYEQQRAAGATLARLEAQVKLARERFTELVIRKRYWESQEGVDQLFDEGSNAEITSVLKKI